MNKKSAPWTPANTPEMLSQLSVEESHDQEVECFLEASGGSFFFFLAFFFFFFFLKPALHILLFLPIRAQTTTV